MTAIQKQFMKTFLPIKLEKTSYKIGRIGKPTTFQK